MNKKTKSSIILSSLAAIAVAGSLIAGSTYALFTSESKTNIAVTSGKVDVKSEIKNLSVYSPTSISTESGNKIIDDYNAADTENNIFANGGTVEINNNHLTITNMTPGDMITFNIGVTNYSNVKVQYRTVFKTIDNPDGSASDTDLFEELIIGTDRIFIDNSTGWYYLDAASDEATGEVVSETDSAWQISLPTTADNSLQGKKCSFAISVEAVQGNAQTFFYGGDGTSENPYIIKDADSFSKLSYYADRYMYYKVADGVSEIDLTKTSPVNLYGEFDGNGVTLIDNKQIFTYAGFSLSDEVDTIFKNFTAKFNSSANAIVFTIKGSKVSFDNVKVTGELLGSSNVGAFVQYGTNNYYEEGDDVGGDYTLTFTNCACDADIISTVNEYAAILVGHAYTGPNHCAKIYVDSATNEAIKAAKVYAPASSNQGRYYYGMSWNKTIVYVNDSLISDNDNMFDGNEIKVLAPKKTDAGYKVEKADGMSSITAQINAQLTAYDNNDDSIVSLSGITYDCGNLEIKDTSSSPIKITDSLSSASVNNSLAEGGKPTYTLIDGSLTIITNTTDNYLTGWISIHVRQFDGDGKILSVGSLTVAQNENPSTSWSIC